MVVDRFSRLDQLECIQTRWKELYESDSAASLFLSWEWVKACLSTENTPWAVLGVHEGGAYLAFLPLRFSRFPRHGPTLARELWLGLSPRVEFTGMLARAGEESRFLPALAAEIKSLGWDTFALNSCGDRRIAGLVAEFSSNGYRIAPEEATPCPYVQLPASWDEYLESRGRSTRRTIRARQRQLESLSGYNLSVPSPDERGNAIDALLRLHSLRWKKDRQTERSAFRELLARCYDSGLFRIQTMYDGKTLMAIHGFFIEPERRMIIAYMITYNPDYAQYSPGMMLGCAAIRWAIENGYDRFSLSRGAQSYKMSLATGIEYISNTAVSRRNARVAAMRAGRSVVFSAKRIARNVLARTG